MSTAESRTAQKRHRLRQSVAKLVGVTNTELFPNNDISSLACLCLLNLGCSGIPIVSNKDFNMLSANLSGKLTAWMPLGRSFSFILFNSHNSAQEAYEKLNERPCTYLDNRLLMIEFAESTLASTQINGTLDPRTILDGITFLPEFVNTQEEADLLLAINELPSHCWIDVQQRRVAHFGYIFDYPTLSLIQGSSDHKATKLPSFLDLLYQRSPLSSFPPPNQATISIYPPGAGIAFHTDIPEFGSTIVSLSLAGGAYMDFRLNGKDTGSLYLIPRSLLVLEGQAREKAEHGIKERKGDWVLIDKDEKEQQNNSSRLHDGRVIMRNQRISIVWRWVPQT